MLILTLDDNSNDEPKEPTMYITGYWALLFLIGQVTILPDTTVEDRSPISASISTAVPDGAEITGQGWILPEGVRTWDNVTTKDVRIPLWADPGQHKIRYKIFWIKLDDFTFVDGNGEEQTITQYIGHGYLDEEVVLTVKGEKPPPDPPKPSATRVTYVYEKDQTAIPPEVAAALNELNLKGWTASEFEEDTRDGEGQVPDQYVKALTLATEKGLPALVVETPNGEVVVHNPKTRKDVIDAVTRNIQ
jgi:hypothetical protein